MNFKNLKKVKRDPSVEELFKFFYVTLYKENENTFKYDQFKKIALNSQVTDFQTRLARFSIAKLDRQRREQIKMLKNAVYPNDNEDFNYLLEWIDYNFEAYVAYKQKEDLENRRMGFKESDKKYKSIMADSKYVTDEQESILDFLTDYIQILDSLEKRIKEANSRGESNSNLKHNEYKTKEIFDKIDRFEGNQLAIELDNLNL